MSKEYLGKLKIPEDQMDWVISQLGKTFRYPFHAFRQYIDNAKDSVKIRKMYDNSFSEEEKLIKIELMRSKNRDERKIRIVDFGTGITPKEAVWETPQGDIIRDEKGEKIPYINSFRYMKNNVANSVKRAQKEVTGEKAVGMLAFLKLNCKKLKFISKVSSTGETYTYSINENLECHWERGGDKKFKESGTEVILEGMHGKTFENYFNPRRLKLNLRKIYHQDLLRDIIKISVEYIIADKKVKGRGRKRESPFFEIKPMKITGEQFEPTQIKTKTGKLVSINLKLTDKPRKDPFIRINNRGTGGVPAETVFYNPIWENEYTQGFIDVDFLNFAGHDKSSFEQDKTLEELENALEEKVVPKLAENISEIKKRKSQRNIMDTIEILKVALSRTIKNLDIRIEGTVERTKTCPQCGKKLSYNHKFCPDCGYEFPRATKHCRFCDEEIPSNAKTCPKCGKNLIEKIKCKYCGELIPELSRVCPECGERLRSKRKEPKGKTPDIFPQPLGPEGPRSAIDKENGHLRVIQINQDHSDYQRALEEGYDKLYMSILTSKEIAKFMYGEEKSDYTEDLLEIFLEIFNELITIKSIDYRE